MVISAYKLHYETTNIIPNLHLKELKVLIKNQKKFQGKHTELSTSLYLFSLLKKRLEGR
jgi:hypothetical protein